MTIAVCYVSPEGVVLGADSTTTYGDQNGNHYYNHGQKLFEVGEESHFGMVTWGMGGLPHVSYRTLIAKLGDSLKANPPQTVREAATRWVDLFWNEYSTLPLLAQLAPLEAKTAHDPAANPPAPNARTQTEEDEFNKLQLNALVGFCIAGCDPQDRTPSGQMMQFAGNTKPAPMAIAMSSLQFWGAPNFVLRLFLGLDAGLKAAIQKSQHWSGSPADFDAIAAPYQLALFSLPMREAVDLVHSCITATIKALKFSSLSQICGGPIELAVVTSDRKFRWVRHKAWDSAITDGDIS